MKGMNFIGMNNFDLVCRCHLPDPLLVDICNSNCCPGLNQVREGMFSYGSHALKSHAAALQVGAAVYRFETCSHSLYKANAVAAELSPGPPHDSGRVTTYGV